MRSSPMGTRSRSTTNHASAVTRATVMTAATPYSVMVRRSEASAVSRSTTCASATWFVPSRSGTTMTR